SGPHLGRTTVGADHTPSCHLLCVTPGTQTAIPTLQPIVMPSLWALVGNNGRLPGCGHCGRCGRDFRHNTITRDWWPINTDIAARSVRTMRWLSIYAVIRADTSVRRRAAVWGVFVAWGSPIPRHPRVRACPRRSGVKPRSANPEMKLAFGKG